MAANQYTGLTPDRPGGEADEQPMPGTALRALPDHGFDLVLTHNFFGRTPDDRAAMAEVARVLRPAGLAVVQVPRRSGTATDEAPDASEDERSRRFGAPALVRRYGDDFEDRLRDAGLVATATTPERFATPRQVDRAGVESGRELWVCHRRDGSTVDPGLLRQRIRPDTLPTAVTPEELDELRTALARAESSLMTMIQRTETLRHRAAQLEEELRDAEKRATEAEQRTDDLTEAQARLEQVEKEARRWRVEYEQLRAHPVVKAMWAVRRGAEKTMGSRGGAGR